MIEVTHVMEVVGDLSTKLCGVWGRIVRRDRRRMKEDLRMVEKTLRYSGLVGGFGGPRNKETTVALEVIRMEDRELKQKGNRFGRNGRHSWAQSFTILLGTCTLFCIRPGSL